MGGQFESLELLRKRALRGLLGGVGLILLTVFAVFALRSLPAAALCGAGAIAAFVLGGKSYSSFKEEYKGRIVAHALNEAFDGVVFDPDGGIEAARLRNTRMINMGNRYHSDDYITGLCSGVRFERADVLIQQVTSNGKTTTVTTLFQGPWMIFDFGKPFRCDLQVAERGFGSNKRNTGFFGLGGYMKKVETESVGFGSRFRVYAEDEHEAFYILTPQMMESITALADVTEGEMMLCFCGGRLHVAVNNGKNAFEPSLFRPVDSAAAMGVTDEIKGMTSFVSRLKLAENKALWKGNDI